MYFGSHAYGFPFSNLPLLLYLLPGLTCKNSTSCPHGAFMSYMDLATNSDCFPTQHELISFYNADAVCLLRGTN